jgi:hypothetical protein
MDNNINTKTNEEIEINGGLCEKCGQPKDFPDKPLCRECYYKENPPRRCQYPGCNNIINSHPKYHWYCDYHYKKTQGW